MMWEYVFFNKYILLVLLSILLIWSYYSVLKERNTLETKLTIGTKVILENKTVVIIDEIKGNIITVTSGNQTYQILINNIIEIIEG